MGLLLRFRAALLLLPLSFLLLHPPVGRTDDRCTQWVGMALATKRKAVQDSFDEQKSAGDNIHADRCLRDSAARMAAEIDAGCRAGGDLEGVWRQAGFAWLLTCSLVADRVQAGTPSSSRLRSETRASVQTCVDEGKLAGVCRKELAEQRAAKSAGRRAESECLRFQSLPKESRMAEVEGRIQERFSATQVVARCMSTEARAILSEFGSLCRRGVEASEAWSQVLGNHTDRCLDRDFGL